jgi:hypothetical protein
MNPNNRLRSVAMLGLVVMCAPAHAQDHGPVHISSTFNQTHTIAIAQDGSVINLPAPPERIVVGRKDVFSVESVGSDIVISPMQSGESTSLFAYVQGRRFSFRLNSSARGVAVYLIDDDPRPPLVASRRKEP